MKAASYAFGVCSRWRVALGSDDGKTFSGVPAAVQQIANLLGFKWDDKRDTQGCTPDDGHVMSRNGERTQYPTFSECSKKSWDERTLMSLGEQPCYKLNLSSMESPLENMTPYKFFKCSESCQNIAQRSENNACNGPSGDTEHCKTGDICKISCCPDYDKYFDETKRGAPDGMPCGEAQVCLQQVCVKLPEQRSELSTVPTDRKRYVE
uniref:Putative metalloprotease n=1 Tax=Ixodes ricinus TaxID=34613 RepID=A0A0K8RGE4_IXORI